MAMRIGRNGYEKKEVFKVIPPSLEKKEEVYKVEQTDKKTISNNAIYREVASMDITDIFTWFQEWVDESDSESE